MRSWIVTGIDTNVGKTLVSAVFVKLLNAHYWKPIEAGGSDTCSIYELTRTICYPPAYQLNAPLSPHHAATLEKIKISPKKFCLPQTKEPLIIEGCGGVLTPLTKNRHLGSLFCNWNLPWILVSKHYLGSLNHTLLTYSWLRAKKQKIEGVVFNGTSYPEGEEFLLSYTKLPCLGRINIEPRIDEQCIQRYAMLFQKIG